MSSRVSVRVITAGEVRLKVSARILAGSDRTQALYWRRRFGCCPDSVRMPELEADASTVSVGC